MNSKYQTDLDDIVYMNHAGIGIPANRVRKKLLEIQDQIASTGDFKIEFEEFNIQWNNVRQNFAKLINGKPEGVAMTHNTAKGLQLVVDGLAHKFSQGKNIVITELEFTTNSYVWQKVCSRYRMELRVVNFDQTFDDFSNYIDDNTIIVSISHVQFSNGFRTDLAELAKLVHEVGGYLVVDAIQSIGALPFDVEKFDVDFLATGAYKWMGGPTGHGYFYMKPELLDEFESVLVGWFSDRHYFNQSHHEFNPWPDVRQYQDHLSIYLEVLNLSIEVLLDLDPSKIFSHITNLQDQLVNSLHNSKYDLITNLQPNHRSGIITFKHPRSELIVRKLKERKIAVAFREGGIRISPHWHNTTDNIETLANSLIELANI